MKKLSNLFKSNNRAQLGDEVATRDATLYISMLNALPNPDPILRKTGGRIETYRELSSDWEVFSAIELIHSGLKELMWEIVPGDADPKGVQFIEDLVKDWDPYDIMTQCIDARNFGYQPFENIWQPVAKKWIITKIVSKPPEWFNYSMHNELQFISRAHPLGKVIEDRRKFIVARNRPSYQNPYGESHYARCFWPVTFKKGGVTFLIKFLEKYGMPWIYGKQPRGTGDKETQKLLKNLHQMVADAVAVIPDDSSIDVLNAGSRSSSTDSYLRFIHYCDSVINKVILSNELSMGASKQGGTDVRGNAGQNYQVSKQVIMSVAGMAMYVINEAIKLVWEPNFAGEAPECSIYEPKDVQKALAERDETLGRTGVRFRKKYFIDNYALGEDDFDLVDPAENKPPVPTPAPEAETTQEEELSQSGEMQVQKFSQSLAQAMGIDLSKLKEVLARKKFDDKIEKNSIAGLDELEKLIEASAGEEAAQEMQDILSEQLQPLIDLVNSAGSYEEVLTALATAYPEMKTEELEDRLAKAYFIADILGRITEQENQEIEE